jgi:serine O-acetyltransferase
MILSFSDYLYYNEADRIALGRKKIKFLSKNKIKSFFIPDHIWNFQKLMRKLEYYHNCKTDISSKIYLGYLYFAYYRLSTKLGFSISINTFGPGLSIAHVGTIILNKGTNIGANCRLNCDVNIGTKAGYAEKAPQIGDNVYIGPGAKIYGDIQIANNVAIGANSVVNKSFLTENISIAGVPAKVISEGVDIFDILLPATDIAKKKFVELPGIPAYKQNMLRKK